MSTFPLVAAPQTGYKVEAVDTFIAQAQAGESALTSADIRLVSFPLVKGGYSVTDVDKALERLEDTVADHEQLKLVAELGADGATAEARSVAQDILNRIARDPRKRFRTAALFTYGYNRDDVDGFADRVRDFYTNSSPLSRADVRSVTFRPQLGGYDEAQVDFVLDELLRVMLAAR